MYCAEVINIKNQKKPSLCLDYKKEGNKSKRVSNVSRVGVGECTRCCGLGECWERSKSRRGEKVAEESRPLRRAARAELGSLEQPGTQEGAVRKECSERLHWRAAQTQH